MIDIFNCLLPAPEREITNARRVSPLGMANETMEIRQQSTTPAERQARLDRLYELMQKRGSLGRVEAAKYLKMSVSGAYDDLRKLERQRKIKRVPKKRGQHQVWILA